MSMNFMPFYYIRLLYIPSKSGCKYKRVFLLPQTRGIKFSLKTFPISYIIDFDIVTIKLNLDLSVNQYPLTIRNYNNTWDEETIFG